MDLRGDRAISNVKVTITCRLDLDDVELDNDVNCRSCFFMEKRNGKLAAEDMTLLFDKDKTMPI